MKHSHDSVWRLLI